MAVSVCGISVLIASVQAKTSCSKGISRRLARPIPAEPDMQTEKLLPSTKGKTSLKYCFKALVGSEKCL